MSDTPIVLISSCASESEPGDARYNGGVKLYNLWAQLLRRHGVPAFIVTWDGERIEWLEHHQPTISLATAREWKDAGLSLRFVTGWLAADAFIDLADSVHFHDAESAYTFGLHERHFRRLLRKKIGNLSTHSRTQQARHLAYHHRDLALIQDWCDDSVWFADGSRRIVGRIGYTEESEDSHEEARQISETCFAHGLDVELVEARGSEAEMAATLRTCDVFLGLNHGKDVLWGEGSPRTQQEAMHAGCVVVAYDVRGNREYVVDSYNGLLAPAAKIERLAEIVVEVMSDRDRKEELRQASLSLVSAAFVAEPRWPTLATVLGIDPDEAQSRAAALPSRGELESALGDPVYMGIDEIPAFAEIAQGVHGTALEIGSAYGGSTALLLLNLPDDSRLVSVDPFVTDSMSDFQATRDRCVRNVVRAVAKLGKVAAITRWRLEPIESLVAASTWEGELGFLYIDGDHRYEAVWADFRAWLPHVRAGGAIIIHDSRREAGAPDGEFARGWPGPTQLAAELRSHECVELEDEVFSMTIWRATARACVACEERAS